MDSMRKLCDRFRTTKLPADVDDRMETLEEYRSRWTSVRIIYYTMFLMSLGFTIIITGIWPYLSKLDPTASKEFMGLVVAANPLGQMLFSPLFGWWSNKLGTIRLPLLCSLSLFAVGSAMYSLLELQPTNVKYWMLASRFLIGVSSANVAVCRSYVSAATRLSERTHAVSMISLAQVLGFIIGPVMQALVTPLGEEGVSWLGGALVMNTYTTCGWINVLMVLGNLLLFLPAIFKEHKISAKEVMIMQGKTSERETWKSIKPDYVSAWTLIMSFFVLLFNFVLLETLGTVLIMDQFACTSNEAVYYMAILMSAGAAVAFVTFLTINPLCKIIAERYLLIVGGFGLMGLGCLLFIPWGDAPPKLAEVYNVTIPVERINGTLSIDRDDPIFLGCPKTQAWCATTPALTATQFTLGYGLVSVGYPIGVTLIQTIFSKILGPRPQGVWMGLMTGSGCFSRILGPVFVGSIYTRLGTYYTFGVTALMMVLTSFWLLFSNKRLLPPVVENVAAVELQELNVQGLESSNDALDSKVESAELPAPENEKLIAQRNNTIITKSFNT